MHVLIDTNILISAILGSRTTYDAYVKAVTYPSRGMICTQTIDELHRVFERRFPHKTAALEQFLECALQSLVLVPVPDVAAAEENRIRDVSDRPIFRAAFAAGADILLTGDKDFLASGITVPRILTAAEFLTELK